jgi:hypothetical protein
MSSLSCCLRSITMCFPVDRVVDPPRRHEEHEGRTWRGAGTQWHRKPVPDRLLALLVHSMVQVQVQSSAVNPGARRNAGSALTRVKPSAPAIAAI